MSNYLSNVLNSPVHQRERLSENQVKNNAGGFVYEVDLWTRLNRFLILGSEGGTYYASERNLTLENAGIVQKCVALDGDRTITAIVNVSEKGRAPKNDTALMALAVCAASDDVDTRRAAFAALRRVARIQTHLFDFLTYLKAIDDLSGRVVRTGLGRWFNTQSLENVAYGMVKYPNRNGWKTGDVLSLGHVGPYNLTENHGGFAGEKDDVREILYNWATNDGWKNIGPDAPEEKALQIVWAYEKAKRSKDAKEIIQLITDFGLTREMIPTEFLRNKDVYAALLMANRGMPLEAMIRNLGSMSSIGLLTPLSDAARYVTERLSNQEAILRARVHPMKLLTALMTYRSGHGFRGGNSWSPVTQVTNALDNAFYLAFGNVESTHKRHVLALDVSGSMSMSTIAGVPGLTPRIASAAMALVTANVEPETVFVAFTSGNHSKYVSPSHIHRFNMGEGITPIDISPKMRIDDVVRVVSALPMGGTDCALPYRWAKDENIPVDAFITYTDNESWAGDMHPSVAIKQYRSHSGIDAKGIVVGMTASAFSIADPSDIGMMDVIGFDSDAPALMAEFVRGNI